MADGNIMKVDIPVDDSVKVVDAHLEGDRLMVTVEGPNVEAVTNANARQIAYRERLKHGYHNAGLEAYGGPYPHDRSQKKDLETHEAVMDAAQRQGDLVYRCQYRLTPGL